MWLLPGTTGFSFSPHPATVEPMSGRVPQRLFVLDVDGTLLHLPVSIEEVRWELSEMFAALGHRSTFVPLLQSIHQAAAQLAGTQPHREQELVRQAYEVVTRHELRAARRAVPVPGLGGLARALGDEPVVLISNNSAESVRASMSTCSCELAGLAAVVGRTPGIAPKPDPAPLVRALQGIEPLPRQLICVGDRPVDMAMATAARPLFDGRGIKITAVGLPGRLEGASQLKQAGADLLLADLGQLVDYYF